MAMAAAAEAIDQATTSRRPPLPATRQEVQDAVAKAVELRALHAALRQRGAPSGNNAGAYASACRSPATIRLPPAASPARSRKAAAAAEEGDYPVFTPTYEEEPMPMPMPMAAGPNDICQDTRSRSENWSGITLDRGGGDGGDEAAYSDYDNCLNGFSSSNSDFHYAPCSSENHLRSRGAHRIHPAFLQSAPLAGRFAASAGRATGTAEFKVPASSSSAFRPATIGRDHGANDMGALRFLSSSSRVPPSSSQHPSASTHSRAKQRGSQILSWFFPKARKKPKSPPPPTAVIERENMSQLLKEWGLLSLDSAKRELAEANAHRDAAMEDAAEMRSSLGDLTTKMLGLEAYCSELKKALRQATDNDNGGTHNHSRRSSSSRSVGASRELPGTGSMPVSHEAMVEGFVQIASEARLSVKQLCKSLIQQAGEPDNGLSEKLNLLLQPYRLAITAGQHCSKAILYHLEAIMNQSLYQDFENCSFHRNGAPRHLDPKQDRRESFDSFVALRNLSWNEVLRKGTRYYSEDLSRFCDQKMSCVVAALGWSWPWPEQLLQCFFVATKCVWLLHLLAFSFGPPLPILRIEENRAFDQMYMEDILPDKRQVQDPLRVKIMVMPGFYVQDRVLKCRVLTTRSGP